MHLTRLSSKTKAQLVNGQGSHWLMGVQIFFIYMLPTLLRCVKLVFKHIHAASSYTIYR